MGSASRGPSDGKLSEQYSYLNESCAEVNDIHCGRSLVSHEDIRVGSTVLQEIPLEFVSIYDCGCSADGILLAEHVELAWLIYREECCREVALRRLCAPVLCESRRNARTALCSGCVGKLSTSSSAQWSLSTLLTMLVASLLCVCIESPVDETAGIEEHALDMFDILSRLPQNTHAVDFTYEGPSTSADRCVSVEQRRVCIAVFLLASSMNHSCEPNCCLKYSIKQMYKDYALSEGYQLEIVALRDIRAGEELTVSYGVIAGRDSCEHRNEVLRRQYLFDCRCSACLRNGNTNLRADRKEHQILSRIADETEIDLKKLYGKVGVFSELCHKISSEISSVKTILSKMTSETIDMDYWCRKAVLLECSYLDTCGYHFAKSNRFDDAANLVNIAIEHLLGNNIYSESDIAIGRELVKLTELLLAGGKCAEALTNARRAFKSLNGFVSDEDPDLQSLLNHFPKLSSTAS